MEGVVHVGRHPVQEREQDVAERQVDEQHAEAGAAADDVAHAFPVGPLVRVRAIVDMREFPRVDARIERRAIAHDRVPERHDRQAEEAERDERPLPPEPVQDQAGQDRADGGPDVLPGSRERVERRTFARRGPCIRELGIDRPDRRLARGHQSAYREPAEQGLRERREDREDRPPAEEQRQRLAQAEPIDQQPAREVEDRVDDAPREQDRRDVAKVEAEGVPDGRDRNREVHPVHVVDEHAQEHQQEDPVALLGHGPLLTPAIVTSLRGRPRDGAGIRNRQADTRAARLSWAAMISA